MSLMVPSRITVFIIVCLSSFSYAGTLKYTCGVTSCPVFEPRPSGCVVAPKNSTVTALHQRRQTVDLGALLPKAKRAGVNITPRGNPLCYYITGAAGAAFLSSASKMSQNFILPAGTYTLRWQYIYTETAFAAAQSKPTFTNPNSDTDHS